ncbi:MAG: P-II family nitrogen regulator, partial [Clostridia bacterium]|nr:P-II family nitrogen regulator [Clostridia bacterium]
MLCIVNTGYSEAVMDAAKAAGARGGTILKARGTGNKEAEKFFKITVQPEKEMVLILVPADIKEAVMHALYKNVGLNTPGQGIAFALPVDNVVGLSNLQVEIDAEQKLAGDKTEDKQ